MIITIYPDVIAKERIGNKDLPWEEWKVIVKKTYDEIMSQFIGWACPTWHSNSQVRLITYSGISERNAKRYFPRHNEFWENSVRKANNEPYSPNEWVFHSLDTDQILFFKSKSCPIAYRIDFKWRRDVVNE